MLRITETSSTQQAKHYFEAKAADYYIEGQEQELKGVWRGKGAERLGLTGEVDAKRWYDLCDNINPETGETLTVRQRANRRVGYDFTWSVPKSVSVLYGLTGDERLLDAFRDAVRETMEEIEAHEIATRVRKGGKDEDRKTDKAIWGEYMHLTSRPVDGIPDPQLHAHCFVMNAVFDSEEQRWKAIQVGNVKENAPYFEGRFLTRMGSKLRGLGLETEATSKGWEIKGFSKATLKKFSRRTEEIEKLAAEKGIDDPQRKGELGAKTRSKKVKNLTLDELREDWNSRISQDERDGIARVMDRMGKEAVRDDREIAKEAVMNAADHLFERHSTVPERKLLAEAMKRVAGRASVETVEDQYRRQGFVFAMREGKTIVTTREVLAQEQEMLAFARDGRGACRPLGRSEYQFRRDNLSAGQRGAVNHVLNMRDRVILVRGAAGVGKTTAMQEAREALEANGHQVFAFAPPAKASRGVLREKGFEDADTVARLLADEKLQERIRGQVLWIDEAGLIGTRTMVKIFKLAKRLKTRVVLSGDQFQHGSVEAGAALRLLENEAGLIPANITEIQRQKHPEYKKAIELLSEGRTAKGFEKLDELGWIKEIPTEERYLALANDYLATVIGGETALVVAPTHREGGKATLAIRTGLQSAGLLGCDERTLPVLVNAQLTVAQRRDPLSYQDSDVILFHQNAKGFRKGQFVAAQDQPVSPAVAEHFTVYRSRTLSIAEGETLRITKNGKTLEGRSINNGDLVKVHEFNDQGDLVTDHGTISRDYKFLAHGYVMTSVASQGTDVHRVFVAQSHDSLAASNRQQGYVSASRGIRSAVFYVDNKKEFLAAVQKSDERLTATELVTGGKGRRPEPVPVRTHSPDRQSERELAYG